MSVLPREEGKGKAKEEERRKSRLGHMQEGPRAHTSQMASDLSLSQWWEETQSCTARTSGSKVITVYGVQVKGEQ